MPNNDYIKRSDALKAIRYENWREENRTPSIEELHLTEYQLLAEAINNIPAADVVPVVRCRDCRHTKTDGIDAIYCQKWDRWEMPPNAYCYLGEKRKAKSPKGDGDGTI